LRELLRDCLRITGFNALITEGCLNSLLCFLIDLPDVIKSLVEDGVEGAFSSLSEEKALLLLADLFKYNTSASF
jgi:hypothetical protein